LEIDLNRKPSSGESSRTNTSGGRITTSMGRDASQFAAHEEFPVKRSWPTTSEESIVAIDARNDNKPSASKA
jgi:hypothetical protein